MKALSLEDMELFYLKNMAYMEDFPPEYKKLLENKVFYPPYLAQITDDIVKSVRNYILRLIRYENASAEVMFYVADTPDMLFPIERIEFHFKDIATGAVKIVADIELKNCLAFAFFKNFLESVTSRDTVSTYMIRTYRRYWKRVLQAIFVEADTDCVIFERRLCSSDY